MWNLSGLIDFFEFNFFYKSKQKIECKKETPTLVFSCEYCKIFKKAYFETASVSWESPYKGWFQSIRQRLKIQAPRRVWLVNGYQD